MLFNWPRVKQIASYIFEYARWIVGDGSKISLYYDNWLEGDALDYMRADFSLGL